MGTYAPIANGSQLSPLVDTIDATQQVIFSLQRGTVEPTGGVTPINTFWACTEGTKLDDYTTVWAGSVPGEAILRKGLSAWSVLMDPAYAQLNAGGTVQMAANLDLGANKIVDVADGSSPTDGANMRNLGRFNGLSCFVADVTQRTANPGGDWQRCEAVTGDTASRFTPRRLVLRLYGDVTKVSGGAPLGAIDETIEYLRWEGHVGSGFGSTYGRFVVKTLTVGSATVEVAIEVVTTAGDNGFYLELKQTSGTPELCTVAMAQAWCDGGFGE